MSEITRTITLDIEPMGAVRSNGKNSMYHPTKGERLKEYVEYKKKLQWLMLSEGLMELPEEIEQMHFFIPVPSEHKKYFKRIGEYHKMKPDIDNLIKPVLDANKKDDSHVARIKDLGKWWCAHGEGKIVLTLKIK